LGCCEFAGSLGGGREKRRERSWVFCCEEERERTGMAVVEIKEKEKINLRFN